MQQVAPLFVACEKFSDWCCLVQQNYRNQRCSSGESMASGSTLQQVAGSRNSPSTAPASTHSPSHVFVERPHRPSQLTLQGWRAGPLEGHRWPSAEGKIFYHGDHLFWRPPIRQPLHHHAAPFVFGVTTLEAVPHVLPHDVRHRLDASRFQRLEAG
jgi:hypothetical protein